MWKCRQESIKKEVEFPGVIKKIMCHVEFPHRSWFLALKIPTMGGVTQFPRVKLQFVLNFQEKSDKSNNSRGLFQKIMSSTHPCFNFFWNSPRGNYRCYTNIYSSVLCLSCHIMMKNGRTLEYNDTFSIFQLVK